MSIFKTYKSKLNQVLKSEGLRQSALTVVGNSFATAMSAVAIILISRILGPEKFGEFSVGVAIMLILVRINDAGLNAALHKYATNHQDRTGINHIFSYTSRVKLFGSIIIFGLGFLLAGAIAEFLNFSKVTIILMAFIFSGATVWYEQLITGLQSLHLFGKAVLVNIIQAAVKLVGTTALFLSGITASGAVFSLYALAPAVPLIFAGLLIPNWVRIHLRESNAPARLLALAKHTSVAFIAAGIIENLDVLFVQKYLDTFETGLYSGISRISMFVILIAYSIGNVLFPRVSRYHDRGHLSKYLGKAKSLAGLSFLGFILFIPVAETVILYTIGPAYVGETAALIVLMASSFFTLAAIPFIALFYSFETNWYFSTSGLVQLGIMIFGNVMFVPTYGLMAAAWTRFATRLFLLLFSFTLGMIIYRRKYPKAISKS